MPRPPARTLPSWAPPQVPLFSAREPAPLRPHSRIRFADPDPLDLYLGGLRLDQYLQSAGQREPLMIRDFLLSLEYTLFFPHYKGVGRPPFAPWLMLGIVLSGLLKGISSLRGLEQMARLDLGCMWIAAGIKPDHSVIGDFLLLHQEVLTQDFFIEMTRNVLKVMGGNASEVAGDGTTLRAVASQLSSLRAEALTQRAQRAKEDAQASPNDPELAEKAEKAEAVARIAEARAEAREAKGRDNAGPVLNPNEPDAAVIRMKDGVVAPGYKGSVLANADRVVVATWVDPTQEVAAVKPMLEQAAKLGGSPVTLAMFDAGYFANAALSLFVELNINSLVPEGKTIPVSWNKQSDRYFPKSRFEYNAATNTYLCPAGQTLTQFEQWKGNEQYPGYRKYRTPACETCPLLEKCSMKKTARVLKRFEGDELREAQRQVMEHPEARAQFKQRQAWVEPVFSHVKEVIGFKRFRRRGLPKVRMEFSVVMMAYNLGRLLAQARRVAARGATALAEWLHRQLRLIRALLRVITLMWPLTRAPGEWSPIRGTDIGTSRFLFGRSCTVGN